MWEELEDGALAMGYSFPVGVDEAGRGPLAGPVVAASCFIPSGIKLIGVNDSKKLSDLKRRKVLEDLYKVDGVKIGVAVVGPERIDEINILNASLEAMLLSIKAMDIQADYLLIDGNRFPKTSLPGRAVVKGDGRVQSIAAASIVAKVHRDDLMMELGRLYPDYGFAKHKGYPTEDHIAAIKKLGPISAHRMTFAPLKQMYNYAESLV